MYPGEAGVLENETQYEFGIKNGLFFVEKLHAATEVLPAILHSRATQS